MSPEVNLIRPLQEGLQPDGTIRVGTKESPLPGDVDTLELSWHGLTAVFGDRKSVTSFMSVLIEHVNLVDAEKSIYGKDELIETVAVALTNDIPFSGERQLSVHFSDTEIVGLDASAAVFANQAVVNETFLKLLPYTCLTTELAREVLGRLNLLGLEDLAQLRKRVVAQGKTEYPSDALEKIKTIEKEQEALAENPRTS